MYGHCEFHVWLWLKTKIRFSHAGLSAIQMVTRNINAGGQIKKISTLSSGAVERPYLA
jgi:hypothetical protein